MPQGAQGLALRWRELSYPGWQGRLQLQPHVWRAEVRQPMLGIGNAVLQNGQLGHRQVVTPQNGLDVLDIPLGDLYQVDKMFEGDANGRNAFNARQLCRPLIPIAALQVVILVHQVEQRHTRIKDDMARWLDAEDHVAHHLGWERLRQVKHAHQIALAEDISP